jgi:preprotein translocase subunit SecE
MAQEKVIENDEGVVDEPQKDAKKAPQVEKMPEKSDKRGPIAAVVLFIRQIFNELKKVTAPTKDELVEYVIVVLVFVVVIMLFITAVDFVIGKGVMALFAK